MKTVQFMNHAHPAVHAAKITSGALSRVYASARTQTQAVRTTQKARREALRALAIMERIHNRVSDILRSTPEAWITREIAA